MSRTYRQKYQQACQPSGIIRIQYIQVYLVSADRLGLAGIGHREADGGGEDEQEEHGPDGDQSSEEWLWGPRVKSVLWEGGGRPSPPLSRNKSSSIEGAVVYKNRQALTPNLEISQPIYRKKKQKFMFKWLQASWVCL